MNTELFIAKRLASQGNQKENLSRLMIRIAAGSIVLGIVVMILAVAIVTGFRSEIERKLIGFGGHLEITNFDSNTSFESTPISNKQDFLAELKALPGVTHVQQFAFLAGIIATPTDNQGIFLKGTAGDFSWSFLQSCLTEGRIPNYADSATSNEVLISSHLSRLLMLKLGDRFETYFVQDPPRIRRFTVVGIFDTQIKEIDESLVICDIRQIQKLKGWSPDQISGFEVSFANMDKLDEQYEKVSDMLSQRFFADGSRLKAMSIKERFFQLFNWLNVLDTNVWVVLSLTLLVAGFNMISGLLIMLLEKVSMIGVLKALGMRNGQLQRTFVFRSGIIVLKAMVVGNIIGIGFCLLQKHFGLIPLDPENYFVSTVPINLKAIHLILLNAGSFAAILLALFIPSLMITRVSPEKSIRFD